MVPGKDKLNVRTSLPDAQSKMPVKGVKFVSTFTYPKSDASLLYEVIVRPYSLTPNPLKEKKEAAS